MALAYTPPGVNVSELVSPSVSPLLAVPATVCLMGMARGYKVATQTIVVPTGTSPFTITLPAGSTFVKVDSTHIFQSVKNLLDPTQGSLPNQGGYNELASTGDFSATLSADSATATITPITAKPMATNGGTILFTYRYITSSYFQATRIDNQSAIEDLYGPAWNGSGIQTPLSFAAQMAFENGASSVICQPLFKLATPGDFTTRQQPSAADAADASNWADTLTSIRGIQDINLLVPVVGQSDANMSDSLQLAIFQKVQDHLNYMQTQGQYVISILGEDSSADITDATDTTLRTHISTLQSRYSGAQNQQQVFLTPSTFTRNHPTTNSSVPFGGQYVAAGLAGMVMSRSVVTPITRKAMSGVLTVVDSRDNTGKNADSQAGLLVIEQKGLNVQVRHGITTDNTSTSNRELSVVRAKHYMIESVRDTLDSQVVGVVPANGNAPLLVQTTVVGVLELLQSNGVMVSYSDVQSRLLTNDPTTVECRFSYRPAFPLNYINVVFSLDLTSGDTDATVSV